MVDVTLMGRQGLSRLNFAKDRFNIVMILKRPIGKSLTSINYELFRGSDWTGVQGYENRTRINID